MFRPQTPLENGVAAHRLRRRRDDKWKSSRKPLVYRRVGRGRDLTDKRSLSSGTLRKEIASRGQKWENAGNSRRESVTNAGRDPSWKSLIRSIDPGEPSNRPRKHWRATGQRKLITYVPRDSNIHHPTPQEKGRETGETETPDKACSPVAGRVTGRFFLKAQFPAEDFLRKN